MAQPDVRGILVAGPLANVSTQYRNPNYIADRVFPIVDGVPPKAKILQYLKGAWFRDEADVRAAGTRAKRGGFQVSLLDVLTVEYAFAKEVTDEDRRYAKMAGAPPLQPDIDAVEFATDRIDLKKERRIAQAIFGATWADGTLHGVNPSGGAGKWAAGTGNTFLFDIRTATNTIHGLTGLRPNTLEIDLGTFLNLKEEPTVLDKIKYTQRAVLTADLLAALLELETVLVGDAIYSSAKETKAGTDFAAVNIWEQAAGKGGAFLFYRPAKPGLKVPTAGYQARCPYEGGLSRRTTTWREEAEHQEVYEVAEDTMITAVGTDLGYLWNHTLAA